MSDNTTTDTTTTPAPFGHDDPRTAFARSVAAARSVIADVRPEQMADPTPCDAFTVHDLLGHLTAVLRRVAVIGAGRSPFEVPDQVDGVADDAWAATWAAAAHDVQAVWSDDVLDRQVQVPWRSMTGREALGIYTDEVLVHTWDLARATGQEPAWDDLAVEAALAAIHQEMPDDGRHEMFEQARAEMPMDTDDWPDPFLAVVPVPDDASTMDRLVAYNGRDPRWSPPS
jgi:uncharacterized protein (TIGR03086 family)